ncbi:MAG: NAD+ synthase, partial [Geminicoccaceae bacterium]|nr:NAD+ synthase [Geminicoccaceae bacterium]
IEHNVARIRRARAEAARAGADLVILSEMVVTGYPLEDLVLKKALTDHAAAAVARLAADTADGGPALVVGAPDRAAGAGERAKPQNCAFLLAEGGIRARIAKHVLPNYGVFDEARVFEAGPAPGPAGFVTARGGRFRLGLMVCEDMWSQDVTEALEESGAELLVVINGSPWELEKQDRRLQHAVARVTESGLPLIYVNQVGGQDELVFDGASFALDRERRLVAQAPWFAEAQLVTRWRRDDAGALVPASSFARETRPDELECIWRAMVLGLRDYVQKNRFPGVVLGLSGGVDSAISAAVAVDALGVDAVHCVMMPFRYTSDESLEDAAECARLLGVRLDTIEIAPAFDAMTAMLAPIFGDRAADTTEENIQSRLRGVTLMAISNKLGSMVLTTGNKSEMSVGYATLYGDMCGGYSVLKDVYKTQVFRLCHWRNAHRPAGCLGPQGRVIPERVILKPPSAELRPDQKDEDSLPPYDRLDAILRGLIENDLSAPELIERGHAEDEVRRVSDLLDLAEYKRRQAPPGVKISERAFGRDRRYPITNAFRKLGLRRPGGG